MLYAALLAALALPQDSTLGERIDALFAPWNRAGSPGVPNFGAEITLLHL